MPLKRVVGIFPLAKLDGQSTERTDNDLRLLGAGILAVVRFVRAMLKAEGFVTTVATKRQEIDLAAAWHGTVMANRHQIGRLGIRHCEYRNNITNVFSTNAFVFSHVR